MKSFNNYVIIKEKIMKLKRRDLNRLIESLLLEVTPDIISPGMDVEAAKRQSEDMSEFMTMGTVQALAEIIAGFTPAGVVIDVKDMASALKEVYESGGNEGKINTALAGIGFIPGAGDALVKAFKRIFKKADSNPLGLSAKELAKMDPKVYDEMAEAASHEAKMKKFDGDIDRRQKFSDSGTNISGHGRGPGRYGYIDNLNPIELKEKLDDLPISVKEYMDVRLTKTSTMNSVSKSGNRIMNDNIPLQATAFEDMMKEYGKKGVGKGRITRIDSNGKVVVNRPGLELAPGDQVMVADGPYVHHEILGITTDGEKFSLLVRGTEKAGKNAGKNFFVSDETASSILSRYPGLVDEIVAKIIQ